MEKRVKYNDLIATAIILPNVIDITHSLEQGNREAYTITSDTLATLSHSFIRKLLCNI
jgi:hypothetical protein